MHPLFKPLRRPIIVFDAGLSFLVNLLLLAPALFMLQLFDRVLPSHGHETLLVLLIGLAVVLTLMLTLDCLHRRLQGAGGNIIAKSLSPAVSRMILAQMARAVDRGLADDLHDAAAKRNLFSAQRLLAVFAAPWALIYVYVILLAHPDLGVAAAGASLLRLALAMLNDRITRRGIEAAQRREANKARRYLEALTQSAEVAQTLGMSHTLIARWWQMSANVGALQGPTSRKSVAMAALTRAMRQSVQVMMLALGAYLVITAEATPGVMTATTILHGRALAPVEQIVDSWRVLADGRLAFRRLQEPLGAGDSPPERMSLPAPTGQLDAQGLVFRLPSSERLILAAVSLALEPGESLAVVGPSGAGKTTLLRLLTGARKPSAGVVRLDHVDIAEWPREELGPWIGYVPQDVELFAGTVAENIARLGEVDSDQVVQAAQRAGVHELILSLPRGHDTAIDHMGLVPSPGQRQRIALARALYGDARLLVLDEPNSNLDGAGELALDDALKTLHGVVTTIVVGHRTTLVQHMDKMLALDAGRVLHYGSVQDVQQALQKAGARAGGGQVVAMLRPVAMPAQRVTAHTPAAHEGTA